MWLLMSSDLWTQKKIYLTCSHTPFVMMTSGRKSTIKSLLEKGRPGSLINSSGSNPTSKHCEVSLLEVRNFLVHSLSKLWGFEVWWSCKTEGAWILNSPSWNAAHCTLNSVSDRNKFYLVKFLQFGDASPIALYLSYTVVIEMECC